MLWFEQGLVRWRWLRPSGDVVAQIFAVDTSGQQVSPCVRYEIACLLIRNTIGSVSCSNEWGMAQYFCLGSYLAQEGPVGGTIAKHDILL
jgi:hypothetical protein